MKVINRKIYRYQNVEIYETEKALALLLEGS